MRITIEITDEQHSKLIEAAARRSERGFSTIVREALDRYFESELVRPGGAERALEAVGSLSGAAADRLEQHARALRRSWR